MLLLCRSGIRCASHLWPPLFNLYSVPRGYQCNIAGLPNNRKSLLHHITCNEFTPVTFALSWWRHQMEAFSALLAICAGNSPVTQRERERAKAQYMYICYELLFSSLYGYYQVNSSCVEITRWCVHNNYNLETLAKSLEFSDAVLDAWIPFSRYPNLFCFIFICEWYSIHDDVIKWEHFPRYWPFEQGIHRSPVNSLHKGQWLFSLICAWTNGRVNIQTPVNWDASAPIMTSL